MEKTKTKTRFSMSSLITVCFCGIILWGFVISAGNAVSWGKTVIKGALSGELSQSIEMFETRFNSVFSSRPFTLDVYSLTQRLLCKQETRNFEVMKANDGQLYLPGANKESDDSLQAAADSIDALRVVTEEYGGTFLYVQCPYKHVGSAPELTFYSADFTDDSEDALLAMLASKGVDTLDLRYYDECSYAYKTDHHWTVQSCFNSAPIICQMLGINSCESFYSDYANFQKITYDDCFLGSIGIKVGPYFTGKDDFAVYNPTFQTNLTLKHYVKGVLACASSGNFWETFIDQSLIENKEYHNKYNALMYGAYCEAIVENSLSPNDKTALLVSHSYGRGLTPYLSLYFKEMRYLDPQEGRYNENYLKYIKGYKPDYVIVMYNGLIPVS